MEVDACSFGQKFAELLERAIHLMPYLSVDILPCAIESDMDVLAVIETAEEEGLLNSRCAEFRCVFRPQQLLQPLTRALDAHVIGSNAR